MDPKSYTREFQIVLGKIAEYYDRDNEVQSVDKAVFLELLNNSLSNPKHREKFEDIVEDAYNSESSTANIDEMIISAKRWEVADKLAVALSNRDKKADDLLREYEALSGLSSLEDMTANDTRTLTSADMEDVITKITQNEGTIKLYPLAIDHRVDGMVRGGHHITTFAVPEMGKSALNVTLSCGFAKQGSKGLYLINEDPEESIYFRHLSCMSGMSRDEIRSNPRQAMNRAEQKGIENIQIVGMAPGNLNLIEALIEKHDPEWAVIDQLMNLDVRGDGPTQMLGRAVRGLRTLAKKHNIVVVSTTQAGDSAESKAVLSLGDVYMSNTEVPAQADLMIGIGASAEQLQSGHRTISFPKNKISGNHNPIIVRFNPVLSRYSSSSGD